MQHSNYFLTTKPLRRLFLLIACSAASSFANDAVVKLRGGMDFQIGCYSHDEKTASEDSAPNKRHSALNSTAYVAVDARNTLDSGFVYGAQVNLGTTARNTRKLSSFLYTESSAGRWELGSNKSANATMKITGYSNACATSGGWDMWIKTDPAKRDVIYLTNFGNFLDQKTRHADHAEYSRKVTYYTPKLKNFQFGISYVPDTRNVGYKGLNDPEYHNPVKNGYDLAVKHAVALGVTHEYESVSGVKIRTAVVGEMGKPIQREKEGRPIVKFDKLRTYTVGTEISYKNASVAMAYANYMKSLTSASIDTLGRNTSVYGATGRYNHSDKLSYSLSHLCGKHKATNINATTLAAEYKVAPGILPYIEVTYYKTSGKFLNRGVITNDGHKGGLLLLGAKLEI